MVARSVDRVPNQTDPRTNERIRMQTRMRVEYYANHPDQVDRRLHELDSEWDIERALETGSSSLSLFGLSLGILGRARWFLLPLVVQGFFLQHAIQGWCPPLPVLRSLGFRTRAEIEAERYALQAIRGDFDDLPNGARGAKRVADKTAR